LHPGPGSGNKFKSYETLERARDVYAVVLTGSLEDDSLDVDAAATKALRAGYGR